MSSHGHCWVEFCDDEGKMTSVGQWPDPYRGDDRLRLNWTFGSCKPVLISPDPYATYRGEKVVHRYCVGTGEQGRRNIERIKERIMHRNDENKLLTHNSITNNCADFAMCIEKFVRNEIKEAYLLDLDLESNFPPTRKKLKISRKEKPITNKDMALIFMRFIYHIGIIFWINTLLNVLYFVPVLGKKLGKGVGVKVKLGEKEQEVGKLKSLHWKSPSWPRKVRVQQQFSPRLAKHSMSFSS
jgi:hypothetical protein